MDGAVAVAVGVLLAVLGALGATRTQRSLDAEGRSTLAPLFLAPFGVLIGAGAAVARGWDLMWAIVVGAVLVPVVGAVGRMLETRRTRRSRGRRGGTPPG